MVETLLKKIDLIAEKKIRVASFFSGAGGLDIGFHSAGYDVVFATDFEPLFCDTLAMNKPKYLNDTCEIVAQDIRTILPSQIPKNIDLVIGGPPCQSFSASGRRAGGAAGRLDQRGTLFQAYSKLIEAISPKAFVFENVRGILGSNKGEDWKAVLNAFEKIGYMVHFRILDAADYGAPQYRERVFLIGTKSKKQFLFPRPLLGPDSDDKLPHIAIQDALKIVTRHREKLAGLKLAGGKYSHLLPDIPPGDNYLYFTEKRGHPEPIFAYRSRFSDFLYKADPTIPVKTVIASPGKYTGPLHWKNRYFSQGEYLAIQGFPQDYKVAGKRTDVIKQIGNAVSPYIAYSLAKTIAAQVFQCPIEVNLLGSCEVLSFDKRKKRKAARTRAYHQAIQDKLDVKMERFKLSNFTSNVGPASEKTPYDNMKVEIDNASISINVYGEGDPIPFADLKVVFAPIAQSGRNIDVTIKGFGTATSVIQTMWNALDVWVRESSSYHSLFELYGHFTEPYPKFQIESLIPHQKKPILDFAGHAAKFENCSHYFPKNDLVKLFSKTFKTTNFDEIATQLRKLRYDIRTRETNIAVPPNVYMLAYPFTLPDRKQMNFSVKPRANKSVGVSYVNFVRAK